MNEGPTTVGSIVGKVKMDRDQWVRDVAAVKAEAREIDALRPDIHIDDNASTVISRMAATKAAVDSVDGSSAKLATTNSKVTAAQAKLTAAMSAADSAYARASLAQTRLNELQDKGVTSGSRYEAAQLALSEALKRLDTANDKVTASELALAAARRANTAETVKANEANKTAATRVGIIVTAVALLVPLLTPVASTAIGLGGAFLGMGAAGVAAIFGIKSEMEKGTDVGNAYRAGINTLRGDMSTLAQTAAVGMLASFRRAVADTNAAMPMLNKQVGQFSSLLGEAGAAGLSGTISSLRILNPLFMTAGIYARSLAQGFEQWASGSGIERFNGYALATFPQVVDVLGKLASMVMHILEALAPLGTVGLAVLSGIADVISSIPVDILSQLIVSLTWGALAFKAWGFVAPMLSAIATSMGAVGAATTIATGPIGWVVAGLSALAGIFAVSTAATMGATRAMQTYTAAVQEDSGVIGQNVRAKAAQQLVTDGVVESAKKYGITAKEVLAAVLNETGARDVLNHKLEESREKFAATLGTGKDSQMQAKNYADDVRRLNSSIDEQTNAIQTTITSYNDLNSMLTDSTSTTRDQQAADEGVAAALGITVSVLQAARAGQKDLTEDTAKATAEMYLQNDAAGLLKQSLDLLNGKTLTAAEAQNRFDSTIANMGAHIDKSGKDVERATASLEGMSSAAVANREELINAVQAASASAQAFRDNGGSAEEARQKLIDMKQAIIDHAVEVGEDRDQVQQFIDKIFQIPASVPPTKLEVDKQEAEAAIAGLIARFNNTVITLQTRIDAGASDAELGGITGIGVGRRANGGTTPGLAVGGTAFPGLAGGGGSVIGPGTAGSDSAGLYRLAHGEEVISNVFGQADRWRSTLKAINAGAVTLPNAGTVPASSRTPSPSPTTTTAPAPIIHINVTGVNQENPQVLAQIIGREVKNVLTGMAR